MTSWNFVSFLASLVDFFIGLSPLWALDWLFRSFDEWALWAQVKGNFPPNRVRTELSCRGAPNRHLWKAEVQAVYPGIRCLSKVS